MTEHEGRLHQALAKLSGIQREAVYHEGRPLLIVAGAGSGKTRTLVVRAAWRVLQGAAPESILISTFTNRAAGEFRARLNDYLGPPAARLHASTLHTLASRLLKSHGELIGLDPAYRVASYPVQTQALRRALAEAGVEARVVPIEYAREKIARAKERLWTPDELKEQLTAEFAFPDELLAVYQAYQRQLSQANRLDFGDLMVNAVRLLTERPELKGRLPFAEVLVDEYQDCDPSQDALLRGLLKPDTQFAAVGDLDQCQPPGTMVLTDRGPVPIEQLDPEQHRLPSYSRQHAYLTGWTKGYPFEIQQREYAGRLYTVTGASAGSTRCTPNHRWLVRWSEEAKQPNVCVVYMMRREGRYRIGWCQLFQRQGGLHLNIRARLESADAVWILKVTEDRTTASIWESYLATRFGLPLFPFEPPHGTQHLTRRALDTYFDLLSGVIDWEERAKACLTEMKLDLLFPFLTPRSGARMGREKSFIVRAVNLLTRYMEVPVPVEKKAVRWAKVFILTSSYEGPVYSLKVLPHETYVADGLVTHNSVYSWRSATPTLMLNFQTTFPESRVLHLGENFRSSRTIVRAATAVVSRNQQRIAHELFSEGEVGAPVIISPAYDENDEASRVARQIMAVRTFLKLAYREIAVLYRCNFQTQAIEEQLLNRQVPYQVAGRRFFERREVANVILYLHIVEAPDNPLEVEIAINWPTRRLSARAWTALEKARGEAGEGIWAILARAATVPGLSEPERQATLRFCQLIRTLAAVKNERTLLELVQAVLKETGLWEYHTRRDTEEKRTLGETAKENLERLEALVARHWHGMARELLPAFLEYVQLMSDDGELADERDAVRLLSLHAAKGTEFPVVFILGCEEGLLPHWRSVEESDTPASTLEEERRLFYVGMTRAQRVLYLYHTTCRTQGEGRSRYTLPSRFLGEIPAELVRRFPLKKGE